MLTGFWKTSQTCIYRSTEIGTEKQMQQAEENKLQATKLKQSVSRDVFEAFLFNVMCSNKYRFIQT